VMSRKHDHDFFTEQFARLEFIGVNRPAHERDIESSRPTNPTPVRRRILTMQESIVR
jgi:hypothetical protein